MESDLATTPEEDSGSRTDRVVKELLESSRRAQRRQLIAVLALVAVVFAQQGYAYFQGQSNSNTIAGLQSKSKEQTKAEVQLRNTVNNQAAALRTDGVDLVKLIEHTHSATVNQLHTEVAALYADSHLNDEFRSLIAKIFVVSLTGTKAQIDALIRQLEKFVIKPKPASHGP